jgi:hypothetical protein
MLLHNSWEVPDQARNFEETQCHKTPKETEDIIPAIRKHQTFRIAISSAETRDKSVSRILLRNG